MHGRIEDTCCSGVVIDHRCALGWLRVAELGEGNSHGASFLGGEEDATGFSFCSGADHILEGVAEDMEECILHRCLGGGGISAQDVPCRSSGGGFWGGRGRRSRLKIGGSCRLHGTGEWPRDGSVSSPLAFELLHWLPQLVWLALSQFHLRQA